MDEPEWAWPSWKFNMRRDDLFTSLHHTYNTLSFTLQDPEAFHHDVFELSNQADTAEEFHELMAERKTQRAREMSESLEALSFEIIANPRLMGTEQWQHAVQLFRTKSYDSIVRYFASYIPDGYLDTERDDSSCSKSYMSETDSNCTASTMMTDVEATCQFCDEDDLLPNGTVMDAEPCMDESQGPPSPSDDEAAPLGASEAFTCP